MHSVATGGDIVADLSLGFWRPFLYKAFPHYGPGLTSAGPLRNRLRTFELLRNRIAHHEHIFTLNPNHNLDNIIALAGFIDPELADYIRINQQVTAVSSRYGSFVLQQAPNPGDPPPD